MTDKYISIFCCSYTLKDTINDRFQIFPTTGRISTTVPLDREEMSKYTLEVIAKDASAVPLSTTTTVVVHVDDINDNAPEFDRTTYTQKVTPPVSIGKINYSESPQQICSR